MNNIKKYREYCKKEEDISVFCKDWWLDAVCGKDNWDVVVITKGGNIMATMPYFLKKKYGFWVIGMPMITQTLGPYIKYPNGQKYAKRLSFEKEIYNKIIDEIPKVSEFLQNFNYRIKNWLPFYWAGYKQTTRYTYLIEDLSNLDNVYNNFSSNIKTDIKKAVNKVNVIDSEDIETFFQVVNKTFVRKKIDIPYSFEFIKNIDTLSKNNKCRKILLAIDNEKNVHSGIYIVWDSNTMYYLLGGGDPKYRNSGATSLLLWEAIKIASHKSLVFDFEGSMLEPVEKFVRAFGATQKPYFQISKTNSKLLEIILFLKKIIK